jgi:hypothetical protein
VQHYRANGEGSHEYPQPTGNMLAEQARVPIALADVRRWSASTSRVRLPPVQSSPTISTTSSKQSFNGYGPILRARQPE